MLKIKNKYAFPPQKKAKYSIEIFVFRFVVSQNKFISYFDSYAVFVKKHANATSLKP